MKRAAIILAVLTIFGYAAVFAGCGEENENKTVGLLDGEIMCVDFDSREELLYAEYRDINGKMKILSEESRTYAYFEIYGNPGKRAV